MPKDYRSTYGQKSLQITDTWEELLNNFGAYHNADVISGRYVTIKKIYNDYFDAMTKRPSYFVHPSASRSIHISSQRQGHASYNNGRSNYNISDRSYNDSRPDTRKSYQPNNRSSRMTGKHSSNSKHQSGERRYEHNRNPNGNANGSSNRSSNYHSSGSNNHSQNRGRSQHDSQHVDDYNGRSLPSSQSPGRHSLSPQASKRNNNCDRSNLSGRGRNNHHEDKDRSPSPEKAFHVNGKFFEDPVPQWKKSDGFKIKKTVELDAQMAQFYKWTAHPENEDSNHRIRERVQYENAINRTHEAKHNKNWSVAPVEKDHVVPSDISGNSTRNASI